MVATSAYITGDQVLDQRLEDGRGQLGVAVHEVGDAVAGDQDNDGHDGDGHAAVADLDGELGELGL